jgi:hypothetical protein
VEIAVVGAVGVVIGAVIAVIGSIVAERLRAEGERNQWQLDRRLEIYTDLLVLICCTPISTILYE